MADQSTAVVTARTRGEALVVRVEGDLDHENVDLLEEALDRADPRRAPLVVIDLSATRFADSAVLHALLKGMRRWQGQGGRLTVAGPFTALVRRLFEVTGTAGFFSLADSVDEALRD